MIETKRFAVSDGLSVAADVGGVPGNPAVVLLHGGGQTRHSWHGAMRELLEQGYYVINLDARGHGDSDWDSDANYGMDALAADLLAVVNTLPSPPALVGASMGGITSLHLVGEGPPDIAHALVLVDVVPRVDPAGAAKILDFMRARPDGFGTLEEATDAVAAYNPNRPRPRGTTGLMKNLRRRGDGRLHWHWDPKFITGARTMEPPQFAARLLRDAQRVQIPTLLVRGMQSDIVSQDGIDEFRRYLPALEIFDVAGAGHMVAGDKNDVFNRGVIGFLQRHLPSKA